MFAGTKIFAIIFLATLIQSDNVIAKQWWETASFYQIYPRSFKDSNGDGIGDLKGITQNLEYLKEIGITATWLSPIFTSPMADFGYDIKNFTEIDPIFGNMADFEALLEKANRIGLKIILDFVPNHSSDECEWFIKSADNDPQYKDFYVWHPGKIVDGERKPPTNWIAVFRGSQWTWHEGRQEYYLHQFHHKQPDLNYRNPKVTETMKDILRFWLRKGIAGFRVDAVPFIFEIAPDANGNWPDEPRNENNNDPLDSDYLNHIYTQNQPETIELVYEFRAVLDEMKAELGSDDLILLTEAYSPLETLMQYYGNDTMEGAQIPFNFELIENLNENSDANYCVEIIKNWLFNMPFGRTANWVLGNHDQKRIGSRLGEDRIDIYNMLLATLPGCSVTYNGEEIGMTNVRISWKQTVDPQACQSNPEEFERLSRDPARTPFQWSDDMYAGFTNGKTTWLPVSDNFRSVNVKRERAYSRSHLNVFKKLQVLRSQLTMQNGDTEIQALNSNVIAIKRSLKDQPTFVVLLNIMDHIETVNLQKVFDGLSNKMAYHLVTEKSVRREGEITKSNSVLLLPKEAVVLIDTKNNLV